ncbi:MAG: TRAP transporter substrate-binding protein DctP [Rhodothalassiaceae bacterium]
MSCRFLVGRIRAVAFAVFFLLPGLSDPTAAAARDLRAAVFVSERVVHVRDVLVPWIATLNAALDGTAHVTLYSGGALGRDGEMQWHHLRRGVSDITCVPTGYEAGRFPSAEILELPVLSDDPVRLTHAAWRLYAAGQLPEFGDVEVLALSVSPAYGLHLAFPVETLADLKGAKIRVVNHVQAELVTTLGAVPVAGIGANALAESIGRGLVDGALFGWHAIRATGVERVSRAHVILPAGFALSVIAMNRDSFAALPPDARAVIRRESGEALSLAFTRRLVEEAAAAQARVATAGHRVYRASPEELARIRDFYAAFAAAWRARSLRHAAFHDALAAALEKARP